MNVSEGDSFRDILYMNFNQTFTALSVGTKNGYMLYDLDQVYECIPTFETKLPPAVGHVTDVCIIERNYNTSLIAYVTLNSPRCLILYNYNKGTLIIEKIFHNTVLSAKLNRKNVVVCLEDSINILDIMKLDANMYSITSTTPNVKGLIAVTSGHENTLLAYPGSTANGDVQIFDATQKHAKTTIPAHTSALAALAFDQSGEKLATASIKGTVIRVFDVASGNMLFQFRRGVKRCVDINSLTFDIDGEFLCASSNTETVHVFKLCAAEPVEPVEEVEEGWFEMFGRVLTQSAKYLPTQMSDVITPQRSFAYALLPIVTQKTVSAIAKIQNTTYVLVATLEGFLYIYKLNTEVGGACVLVKQHRLDGPLRVSNSMPNTFHSTSSKLDSLSKDVPQSLNKSDSLSASASPPNVSEGIFPCTEVSPELCVSNGSHSSGDDGPVFQSLK